jgi:hypothetical protein
MQAKTAGEAFGYGGVLQKSGQASGETGKAHRSREVAVT